MPDPLTPEQRHLCMSRIHSTNTTPEVTLRRELWKRGFRYRLSDRRLPGTPDVVLPKYRTVIFVNGCFWHGHKGCNHYVMPKTNRAFWEAKIRRNRERDLKNAEFLSGLAWNVVTVWECELTKSKLPSTIDMFVQQIKEGRFKWLEYSSRRRLNRAFALSEARKRREILAHAAASPGEDLNIPSSVKRLSIKDPDYFLNL